jgi:hypothetical protein
MPEATAPAPEASASVKPQVTAEPTQRVGKAVSEVTAEPTQRVGGAVTYVTAEQIEMYGKKEPRPLLLDANVIAYFGDLLRSSNSARRTAARALNQ